MSVELFLVTLPSKEAKKVRIEQKEFDEMKWQDKSRGRELHYLYEQEVDQDLKHLMGYKYRQRPFLHFMEEYIEEQNKIGFSCK